ncbi:response regulator [Geodermatophilus sp. SYSU D00705]
MPVGPLWLLVADDDPRVRAALTAALSEVGGLALLAVCGSAAELRRCLACARPDVVLLDVHLPDAGTGLALLEELASAAVPAVAMSAAGSVRRRALVAGAAAFVEKDGALDGLVAALLAAGTGGVSGWPDTPQASWRDGLPAA